MVTIETTAGRSAAAQLALSAATHVPAQVLLGVSFGRTLMRRGLALGLTAGTFAYLAASLLLAHLPWAVVIGGALALLILAPRAMTKLPLSTRTPRRRPLTSLMTCAGTATIVGSAVLATHLAGPTTAGAIAAFPTMSTLLTISITRHGGVGAGAHALGGLVRSLPCYLTFCLAIAFLTPLVGLLAVPVGLLLCAGAAGVAWRAVPTDDPGRRSHTAPVAPATI